MSWPRRTSSGSSTASRSGWTVESEPEIRWTRTAARAGSGAGTVWPAALIGIGIDISPSVAAQTMRRSPTGFLFLPLLVRDEDVLPGELLEQRGGLAEVGGQHVGRVA